jgi:dienelactone hydrolase
MHHLVGELPDLFTFVNGERVVTVEDWRRRREELRELLLSIEYGHLPPEPEAVRAELLHPTAMKRLNNARHFGYRLNIEGGARPFWFIVDVLLPEGEGPFPVVINGDLCWGALRDEICLDVLGRGYALVTFNRTEIVPDAYHSDRDTALYLLYPDGDFAAIAAWAWGYHRVVDFLLTQDWADPARVAVTGHSRGGKTVLLAGATDERIALTGPNNSGSNGAGCFRWHGEGCEKIEDGLRMVPYWYCPRLADFVGKEDQLPFDQHSLKALVAPRALVSMEALGDVWANPSGTYQTYDAAREAYRFLGAESRLGIWYREGDHEHGPADWQAFLDFADWHLRGLAPARRFDENPFPEMPRAFSWKAPVEW